MVVVRVQRKKVETLEQSFGPLRELPLGIKLESVRGRRIPKGKDIGRYEQLGSLMRLVCYTYQVGKESPLGRLR